MFGLTTTEEASGQVRRHALYNGVEPVTYRTFVDLLVASEEFRRWFSNSLATEPFDSFRLETPGVTQATVDQPFQFVVVDAPEINLPADPGAFAEYLAAANAGVCSFPNLGGDALMVVPEPLATRSAYAHLAVFLREAPAGQADELWRVTGRSLAARLSAGPLWLNTAGGGVPWLHIRLDSRPKYYAYAPYRDCD